MNNFAQIATLTIFCTSFSQMLMADDRQNPCVSVYGQSVQKIEYIRSESALADFVYRNTCSSANRSISAGFDQKTTTLIGAVPAIGKLIAKLGVSSNKEFCDESDRRTLTASVEESLVIEPLESAQSNFNQCLAIFNEDRIELTHVVASPGIVTIFVRFQSPDRKLEVQTLVTTGGFTCSLGDRHWSGIKTGETDNYKPLVIRSNKAIICTREGINNTSNGIDYIEGVIQVGTSVGPYTVKVADDTILAPSRRRDAATAIAYVQSDLNNSLRLNANLEKMIDGVSVESKNFYFGDRGDIASQAGTHFDCNYWHRKTQVKWEEYVPSVICPGADKSAFVNYKSHNGDTCGYNYFSMACLYFPKSQHAGSD